MIRFTKSGNGEPVYVSPELIVSAEIVDGVMMLSVRSDRIFVTESPAEVIRKWYADEDTHMIKRRSDGDYAPIALDHVKRARNILHEIGVTVE